MKNIHHLLFFILVSGFSISTAISQSIILRNFSLSKIGDSVLLKWTIKQGETCNGIQVERSSDNLNFQEVGNIPGVCGSPDFAQTFEFLDTNPVVNTTNYYRLVLGNTGYSEVRSIEVIALNEDGILVLPNPASESTTVYFKNDFNKLYTLKLFSSAAKLILEMEGSGQSFPVNTSILDAGVYVFRISQDGEQSEANGKIVVVH